MVIFVDLEDGYRLRHADLSFILASPSGGQSSSLVITVASGLQLTYVVIGLQFDFKRPAVEGEPGHSNSLF